MNVDKISALLVDLFKKKLLTKPIVLRLKGNSLEEAEKLLLRIEDPHNIHRVADIDEACEKAVMLAKAN